MPESKSHVLALCDRWEAIQKGPSPTTTAIREAYAKDMARIAQVARDAAAEARR